MRWSRSRHAGDGFGSLVTGGGKAVKWLCKRPPREVLSYPPIWYRRTSNVNVNVVLVIELPFRNVEKREFMHLRQEKIRDSDKTSGSTFGWHNYTILNIEFWLLPNLITGLHSAIRFDIIMLSPDQIACLLYHRGRLCGWVVANC